MNKWINIFFNFLSLEKSENWNQKPKLRKYWDWLFNRCGFLSCCGLCPYLTVNLRKFLYRKSRREKKKKSLQRLSWFQCLLKGNNQIIFQQISENIRPLLLVSRFLYYFSFRVKMLFYHFFWRKIGWLGKSQFEKNTCARIEWCLLFELLRALSIRCTSA